MTPELHALARETAHRHTSRCTGVTMGRLSPYERYHSAAVQFALDVCIANLASTDSAPAARAALKTQGEEA